MILLLNTSLLYGPCDIVLQLLNFVECLVQFQSLEVILMNSKVSVLICCTQTPCHTQGMQLSVNMVYYQLYNLHTGPLQWTLYHNDLAAGIHKWSKQISMFMTTR